MLHRAIRRFSLLILVTLLASVVPPATTHAVPVRPPPRPIAAIPALLDDTGTGRLPTIPPAAHSTPLPAAAADAVAAQVEGAHEVAGVFDGQFNEGGIQSIPESTFLAP